MKVSIFSVYDVKAKAYLQPFYAVNQSVAVRMIERTLADPDHQFAQNPEDYKLFSHGTYDDCSGLFETVPPEHIVDLHTL